VLPAQHELIVILIILNVNESSKRKFKFKFSFSLHFPFLNSLQIKIKYTPLKSLVKNFYMTDNISKNSKIMAECSLFVKNSSNFI